MSPEMLLLDALRRREQTLALAESCTGGAISARLVAVPGASTVLLGSVVAYCDAWKEALLGVPSSLLRAVGAVSSETVEAMVRGLFARTSCDVAAAVSGIAGPTGATPDKPLGTIWIALGERGQRITTHKLQGSETRAANIELATTTTLQLLLRLAGGAR